MKGFETFHDEESAASAHNVPIAWLASCTKIGLILLAVFLVMGPRLAAAQVGPDERRAAEVLDETPAGQEIAAAQTMSLSWLELLFRGGWLMVPIALMSIVVVALGIERAVALRRGRVLPEALVTQLEQMTARDHFDATAANALCRKNASVLGRVVQAMLSRSGRSSSEIEHAISEACQREADEMYGPVRTINLAMSVTPLLGLLGTVLGMIEAFFATANLVVGANRSQALAEGIYVALVTTFAGLSVAIPAGVLAHLFESRILRLMRDVEQITSELVPRVEVSRMNERQPTITGAIARPTPLSKAS